jgi:hypothetical protein
MSRSSAAPVHRVLALCSVASAGSDVTEGHISLNAPLSQGAQVFGSPLLSLCAEGLHFWSNVGTWRCSVSSCTQSEGVSDVAMPVCHRTPQCGCS